MSLDTSTKVERLLKSLGNNFTDVRAKLTKYGMKGTKSGYTCPVANFLKSRLKITGHSDCHVGSARCRVMDEQIYLPQSVATFIMQFDHDDFPELVQQ